MNPETPGTTSVVDPVPAAAPSKRPRRAVTPIDDPGRCQHRLPNGKRCRLPGLDSQFGLCFRHFHLSAAIGASRPQPPSDFEDLSADLLPQPSEFDAALSINQFLSRLLVLVTKGRVTPRRAAVLAYITNQLLHSHRAIQRENDVVDDEPQQIIFDMPRPERDWPEDPERAMYKHLAGDATPAGPDRSQPNTGVPVASCDLPNSRPGHN